MCFVHLRIFVNMKKLQRTVFRNPDSETGLAHCSASAPL